MEEDRPIKPIEIQTISIISSGQNEKDQVVGPKQKKQSKETVQEKVLKKIKNMEWQDWVLIGIIAILLFYNFLLVSPLKQLPSPLYGGDYYHQLGSVYHISSSLNPIHWFQNADIFGALPMELPVYGLIVSCFVWLFGFTPMKAMFVFSFFVIILSSVIIYLLSYKITKNKTVSLLGPLLFLPLSGFPVVKYTDFTAMVSIPLFLLSLYLFYDKPNIKNSFFVGITYAITSLSHQAAFITINWLLLFVFGSLIYGNRKNLKDYFKANYIYFLVIGFVGIPFALLYWWKPIFVYHLQTKINDQEWVFPSFKFLSVKFGFLWDQIKNYFFNFSSIRYAIRSIFIYPGIILLLFSKKYKLMRILVVSAILLVFSYFITTPLGFDLIPYHNSYLILNTLLMFVSSLGVLYVSKKLRYQKIIIVSLIIILLIGTVVEYQNKKEDMWYLTGLNPLPNQLLELQEYLLKNTDVNSGIFSSNENSFALNAISGRKILANRRAHNDKFLDFDEKQFQAAVIMYGNDTQEKLEFLRQNKIEFFYWDANWINSEYYLDNEGEITGWFDPLVLQFPEKYGPKLKKENISYFVQNTWLDPSSKGEQIETYDLIFVSPQYRSFEKPWKEDLDPYLKQVWEYKIDGKQVAVLYKINYP